MSQRTSLPRICIALGLPDADKLLNQARREVEAGESFFEFRLDYLSSAEAGVEAIRAFLEAHPECTILATCRRHQNQGRFNGSIEEQIRMLAAAIDAGAKAVDIEIESAEHVNARLDSLRGKAKLIVSYHNFDGTPATEAILRRMQKIPADAYKIVTTARKPSDNAARSGACENPPAHAGHRAGYGRDRVPHPRPVHGMGRAVHLRGSECGGGYGRGPGQRAPAPASLPAREVHQSGARFMEWWRIRCGTPSRPMFITALFKPGAWTRCICPSWWRPPQLRDFFTLADGASDFRDERHDSA